MIPTKGERLNEFFRRLAAAPPASSFEGAFDLLAATLNGVEDELTRIPFDPSRWMTDGRMYPPQVDAVRELAGFDEVRTMRSAVHRTYVRTNGAIEIESLRARAVVFRKPGGDGRGVWDP